MVSGEERKRLWEETHQIAYDTFQTNPIRSLSNLNLTPSIDLRFSGLVKTLLFAVRNKKSPNEWSIYDVDGKDPVKNFMLTYEESQRLNTPNYFTSFLQPFFHANSIGGEGIHMYSYSHGKMSDGKFLGSTNFGKLTNVCASLVLEGDISDCELIVIALGKNILNIEGGTVGVDLNMKRHI
jgi:hypothetical protein